jgi:transcriptional regulator with XRE-family HTH domain
MLKKSFGELLREIRENLSISMRSLAGSADMDPAYLSRIENGKTGAPKQETVERLADALCKEHQLEQVDCERLTRQLLVSADHLQEGEELIDDLANRFSDRLRDAGFPEENIDEAMARVPLATMRKVLLGEEKLEIGRSSDFSSNEVQARRDAGEEVIAFEQLSVPDCSASMSSGKIGESASSYLDQHARDFSIQRRQKRARSSQGPQKIIRAGGGAEIHLQRPVNKEQEQQLRLIAKLITTILEEK